LEKQAARPGGRGEKNRGPCGGDANTAKVCSNDREKGDANAAGGERWVGVALGWYPKWKTRSKLVLGVSG